MESTRSARGGARRGRLTAPAAPPIILVFHGLSSLEPALSAPRIELCGTAAPTSSTPGAEGVRDEAHVPAQQQKTQEDARFPNPNEVARRAAGHREPAPQGPQASSGLSTVTSVRGAVDGDRRFPSTRRIRTRPQFLDIYRRGRCARTHALTLFALPNDQGTCRLGVTATRKLGKAVVRNRAKRQLREVFRRNRERLDPSLDLVVNAHREIAACSLAQIEKDFLTAFQRLTRGDDRP